MLRNKVHRISNKFGTHLDLEHDVVKCQTLHWLALELGSADDGYMQEHTICHNHSAHWSNNIIISPILTNSIVQKIAK
jgi:hypothetical protein